MIKGLEPGRRAALIISELQRGVVEPDHSPFPELCEQVHARNIIPKTAALAAAFRAAGLPVVHAHVALSPDFGDLPLTSTIMAMAKKRGRITVGSVDAQSVAGLEPQPQDVLDSRGFSLIGLHGTDLDARLRNMGVQTLVFTGVSTNVAISGMAMCASDLGYQSVIAEDCIAGSSAEAHAFIVKNFLPLYSTLAGSQQIVEALKSIGERS